MCSSLLLLLLLFLLLFFSSFTLFSFTVCVSVSVSA